MLQDADAGGECVSWCCFVEQDIRIGGATVVAANVTGVGTWKHRRRSGYSSIVLEGALQWMKRQGMHITLLSGVPNYYHQFGYVSVMPEHTINVLASTVTERAASGPGGLTIDDATPDDAPAICAIYNADNATRTLSVARPLEMVTAQLESAIRSGQPDPPMRSWRFVQTPDKRLGGLLSVSEDETTARVRFFGELPEDVDPDDITAKSDDPDNKHYEMEVPAEGLTRASFWGSNWRTVRDESGEIIAYFSWSEPRRSPWGNRGSTVNWDSVDVYGWQADNIGRGGADKDALSGPAVQLSELGGPTRAFPAVAAYLAEQAPEGARIQASLPADHLFCRYLRQVGAFEYTTHPWSAHTMVRVVDQAKLFQALLPEIGRRLWTSSSAEARAWRGVAAFTTELGTVCLSVEGDADTEPIVSIIDGSAAASAECTLAVPQHRLTQLLFGTVTLDIVALDEGQSVTLPTNAQVGCAMSAMFPPGTPWRWDLDFM